MADLPKYRMQMQQPPFFHTGVDCFGPFSIKQGRSTVKRYGCIFTCMTVGAVHLEVLHSLSTDSFISALRRFISRRGSVGHLYSNNGTNFTGADRALRESIKSWNKQQIKGFLLQREIEWNYNPPLASHFGGVWEGLVRSVRRVMASFSHHAMMTDEGLVTLFSEVESILNSRPLTPVSFVEDLERPLAPKDLLLIGPDSGLPPANIDKSDIVYRNRWRHVQNHADLFWKRWAKEYLPIMNERQKWFDKKRNVSENDVAF